MCHIHMLLLCCLRQLSEISADLAEEHTTSHHASEILEAEQAERRRLEKECKDLTVGFDFNKEKLKKHIASL